MFHPSAPLLLLTAATAVGQTCQPGWTTDFRPQDVTTGWVHSAAVFDDDGPGPNPPALYVAGPSSMGGTPTPSGMAKWNGSSWVDVPTGVLYIHNLRVADLDGPGPAPARLYFFGQIQNTYGLFESDGAAARLMAEFIQFYITNEYHTLACFYSLDDDGSGPNPERLYVGVGTGHSFPGGSNWFGALFRRELGGAWSRIAGIDGEPGPAAVVDPDGEGPLPGSMYIAHRRMSRQGEIISRSEDVARVEGNSGVYVFGSSNLERSFQGLASHDPDGPGPEPARLAVAGLFSLAPPEPAAMRVAMYDGAALVDLGLVQGSSIALTSFQSDPYAGGGPSLYAAGQFSGIGGVTAANIARLKGQTWSGLGSGLSSAVGPLLLFDWDGNGPQPARLAASGSSSQPGQLPARGLALWDGAAWLPPGNVVSHPVHALLTADLGDGPALYAGGAFVSVGGIRASGVARWDGTAWSPLGAGFNGDVDALAVHHEAGVPRLVAAGKFTQSAVPVNHVAILRQGEWSPLGAGIDGDVACLLSAGGALYAGGPFQSVPGAPGAKGFAKWDGSAWRSLGAFDGDIAALAHFQGSVYAAGNFNYITNPDNTVGLYARIARFDGAGWVSPGYGVNYYATSMAVHNDGSGEALYVGGAFDTASGVPASRVARWSGGSWSAVGEGFQSPTLPTVVTTLASIPESPGISALYAGGNFTSSGPSTFATRLARWNGSQWSGLQPGVSSPPRALAALDPDGPGPVPARLYIGGDFLEAGGSPSPSLASYVLCSCYPNCDGSSAPPVLNVNDFVCFLGLYAAGDPRANCDGSTAAPVLNISDFVCFQQKFAAGCP